MFARGFADTVAPGENAQCYACRLRSMIIHLLHYCYISLERTIHVTLPPYPYALPGYHAFTYTAPNAGEIWQIP